MINIEIIEKRGFSVGYDRRTQDQLAEQTKVKTSFHLHDNGLVKHQSGSYFKLGAFEGYYLDTIVIDGKSVYDNKLLALLRAAHKSQAAADIAAVKKRIDHLVNID